MYGHVAAGSAPGSNWSLNPAPGTPAGWPRGEGIAFYGQPKEPFRAPAAKIPAEGPAEKL